MGFGDAYGWPRDSWSVRFHSNKAFVAGQSGDGVSRYFGGCLTTENDSPFDVKSGTE